MSARTPDPDGILPTHFTPLQQAWFEMARYARHKLVLAVAARVFNKTVPPGRPGQSREQTRAGFFEHLLNTVEAWAILDYIQASGAISPTRTAAWLRSEEEGRSALERWCDQHEGVATLHAQAARERSGGAPFEN